MCVLLDHDGTELGMMQLPIDPNVHVSILVDIDDEPIEFEFEDWSGDEAIFRRA